MSEETMSPSGDRDTTGLQLAGVEGWASDGWGFGDEPAVIVNPGAPVSKLLAWGVGQLEQIDNLMSIMTCSTSAVELDPSDVVGAFRHQLMQTLAVLRQAADQLFREEVEARRAERKHG